MNDDVDCFVVTRLSAMHAMPAMHAQAWHAGKDGQREKSWVGDG